MSPMMSLQSIYRDVCARDIFRIESADGVEALSCARFILRVECCRAHLAAAGVRSGDAVFFHGDQSKIAIIAFWATVLEGAIFVPVDTSWPAYLLGKACATVAPALALVDNTLLPAWQGLSGATKVMALSVLEDGLLEDVGTNDADIATEQFASAEIPLDTPAVYLFTSGSTGDPKAVVLSHAALARSARLVMDTFDWQSGERLLNLADPHTMSGLRNAFVAAPLAGMAWVCAPKRMRTNVFALLACIQRTQPQRMVAAPMLLRHVNLLGAQVEDAVFASTKAVYCTGTDLNVDEVRRFHARFGIPVVNYYGLTETVGLCVSQDVREWSVDDASIGRPVGCQARVVDDDGGEVAQGEAGELQVLLEYPMSGYLHDIEATVAMFDGRWLSTGDLVRLDADGRVSIVGRSGNFIKTLGTEKIQPQEIEAVLEQCPGVAEVAVFGWNDPAGGERIAALIVAGADADEAALADSRLAAFVRERLGPSRVPTIFRRVAAIPRSANGKTLRKQLRDFV
jgi:acyl-coenzyme A synthetase/AMP-(fatty) acid ligase